MRRPGRSTRRAFHGRLTLGLGAGLLAASGAAWVGPADAVLAQDAGGAVQPPGPEAARRAVPAQAQTIVVDSAWIADPRGRAQHLTHWSDTWLETHPTYKVEHVARGSVLARLASGDFGHLIQFPPEVFGSLRGYPGLFVPIDADMAQRGVAEADLLTIPEIETYAGQRFGLPLETNLFGWMLNRTKFEQQGLPLPAAGWTYEEAIQIARSFVQAPQPGQAATMRWGLVWPWDWSVLPLLHAAGVPYLAEDKESVSLKSDEAISVLQTLIGAVQRDRVAPTDTWREANPGVYRTAESRLQFFAILDNFTGTRHTQTELAPSGIRWENVLPPVWRATGGRSVLIDGDPLLVTERAGRDGVRDACVDLLFHLLSETAQEQYFAYDLGLPTLRAYATDPRYVGPPPDSLGLLPQMWLDHGRTFERFAGSKELLTAWVPLLKRAWNGELGAGQLGELMTEDGTKAIQLVRRPPWGR